MAQLVVLWVGWFSAHDVSTLAGGEAALNPTNSPHLFAVRSATLRLRSAPCTPTILLGSTYTGPRSIQPTRSGILEQLNARCCAYALYTSCALLPACARRHCRCGMRLPAPDHLTPRFTALPSNVVVMLALASAVKRPAFPRSQRIGGMGHLIQFIRLSLNTSGRERAAPPEYKLSVNGRRLTKKRLGGAGRMERRRMKRAPRQSMRSKVWSWWMASSPAATPVKSKGLCERVPQRPVRYLTEQRLASISAVMNIS